MYALTILLYDYDKLLQMCDSCKRDDNLEKNIENLTSQVSVITKENELFRSELGLLREEIDLVRSMKIINCPCGHVIGTYIEDTL